MTKIKVSSLQPGPQMNALVARAQSDKEFIFSKHGVALVIVMKTPNGEYRVEEEYNPSTDGGQAFSLIEEYEVHVTAHNDPITGELTGWECETFPLEAEDYQLYRTQYSTKAEGLACGVCRAVIAAHFGDEVEVEE